MEDDQRLDAVHERIGPGLVEALVEPHPALDRQPAPDASTISASGRDGEMTTTSSVTSRATRRTR